MFGSFMFSSICSLGEGKRTKLAPERFQLEMDSVDVTLQLAVPVEIFLAVWTDGSPRVLGESGVPGRGYCCDPWGQHHGFTRGRYFWKIDTIRWETVLCE